MPKSSPDYSQDSHNYQVILSEVSSGFSTTTWRYFPSSDFAQNVTAAWLYDIALPGSHPVQGIAIGTAICSRIFHGATVPWCGNFDCHMNFPLTAKLPFVVVVAVWVCVWVGGCVCGWVGGGGGGVGGICSIWGGWLNLNGVGNNSFHSPLCIYYLLPYNDLCNRVCFGACRLSCYRFTLYNLALKNTSHTLESMAEAVKHLYHHT